MNSMTATQLISALGLVRHPEGGWFRESYRSPEQIEAHALPPRFGGSRVLCTAIYFLLQQGEISALHRIKSDELWHYHAGSSLLIHTFTPGDGYRQLRLGPGIASGEEYQVVAPAGSWFGAELQGGDFALVGCTVAPGFDFADFEMGSREELLRHYPEQGVVIHRMTRDHTAS